ncbi:MFS transporter [Rhodovarius crocodyli]|uniref:MFS transporter n=1 Tax=Rhodovarius crocodyli TaxID=1979269 RepID=A0A437MMV4_9PROT|nr:MFS transporter [Rhodovarius crocodyli]RVT98988.1 MFS transporter [Rhodovarius crocodyli]
MPNPTPFWRDRRFLVLLLLGFSAGVPLPLSGFVLRQWFSESGLSLAAIGFTAWIGLAYSFKFLWSPVLDQIAPPGLARLGRRRGWLLLIQPALMVAIIAMGQTSPASAAQVTAAIAVLIAFLSASQDIVVDAWRIEMLEEEQQGYGLAAYVWGYRGALLASSTGGLALVGTLGWDGVFIYCAGLILLGLIGTLLGPEVDRAPQAPLPWGARLRLGVVEPFAEFLTRRHALAILIFVGLFKLGEALAGVMTAPFYRELGFSRGDVAAVSGFFGMFATLGGALAGGWVVAKLGTGRALIITGLFQMLSNLLYVVLGWAPSMPMLFVQVGVENFTDGLADAAFLTYLSSLTARAFTATQYALLSSLASVPLRTLGGAGGVLAQGLGWSWFFVLTTAAALPALAVMLFLLRRLPAREG